jgi:hypothetical protein
MAIWSGCTPGGHAIPPRSVGVRAQKRSTRSSPGFPQIAAPESPSAYLLLSSQENAREKLLARVYLSDRGAVSVPHRTGQRDTAYELLLARRALRAGRRWR